MTHTFNDARRHATVSVEGSGGCGRPLRSAFVCPNPFSGHRRLLHTHPALCDCSYLKTYINITTGRSCPPAPLWRPLLLTTTLHHIYENFFPESTQIFFSGLNGAQLALLHAPTLGSVGNGGEGGCGGGGSSGGDGCGGGRPSAVTTAAAAGDSAAAAASPSLVLR